MPTGTPDQNDGATWPRRGIDVRPVAIPDDVDSPTIAKATGLVVLPRHVRWSGPARTYDLAQLPDLISLYQQVLREGTADDVRRFIEVDRLVELWDQLVLPDYVRRAWASWLAEHRGLRLAC